MLYILYYKLWNVNLLLKKLLNEKSLGSYISLEIVKVTFWKYAPTRGLIYLVWNYWTALERYYNINFSTFNCWKKYELKQKKLGSNLLIFCWKTLLTLELANCWRVLAYSDRKTVGNRKCQDVILWNQKLTDRFFKNMYTEACSSFNQS